MPKFNVIILVDALAVADVEVEADTLEQAEDIVHTSIDRDGWESPHYQHAVFEPVYHESENLRVLFS